MHRCQKTTVKIKNKEFIACVIYIFFNLAAFNSQHYLYILINSLFVSKNIPHVWKDVFLAHLF